MSKSSSPVETLNDIKRMMERSGRFISLSGLSGIAAGTCALIGAGFAYQIINAQQNEAGYVRNMSFGSGSHFTIQSFMGNSLFQIAIFTLAAAILFAFIFTYLRSKKTNTPIWGSSARRLMFHLVLPLIVGGCYLLKLIEVGAFGLIAPGCLLFYGLALLNASKYTLGEVKYLGLGQIALGLINLIFTGYGIYFWSLGFGILHIVYGVIMWYKYERN